MLVALAHLQRERPAVRDGQRHPQKHGQPRAKRQRRVGVGDEARDARLRDLVQAREHARDILQVVALAHRQHAVRAARHNHRHGGHQSGARGVGVRRARGRARLERGDQRLHGGCVHGVLFRERARDGFDVVPFANDRGGGEPRTRGSVFRRASFALHHLHVQRRQNQRRVVPLRQRRGAFLARRQRRLGVALLGGARVHLELQRVHLPLAARHREHRSLQQALLAQARRDGGARHAALRAQRVGHFFNTINVRVFVLVGVFVVRVVPEDVEVLALGGGVGEQHVRGGRGQPAQRRALVRRAQGERGVERARALLEGVHVVAPGGRRRARGPALQRRQLRLVREQRARRAHERRRGPVRAQHVLARGPARGHEAALAQQEQVEGVQAARGRYAALEKRARVAERLGGGVAAVAPRLRVAGFQTSIRREFVFFVLRRSLLVSFIFPAGGRFVS